MVPHPKKRDSYRCNSHHPYDDRRNGRDGGRPQHFHHGGGGRGGNPNYYDQGGRRPGRGRGREERYAYTYPQKYNRSQHRAPYDRYGPPESSYNGTGRGNEQSYRDHARGHNSFTASRPDVAPVSSSGMSFARRDDDRAPLSVASSPPSNMNMDTTVNEMSSQSNGVAQPNTAPSTSNGTPRPDTLTSSAKSSSTNFRDMTYAEQLEAQIPHTEKDKESFKRNLPEEAFQPCTKKGFKVRVHGEEWKARKEKIVEKLTEKMHLEQQQKAMNAGHFDPDDSDDMIALMQDDFVHEHEEISLETRRLAAFLDAIPTCHLATVGFDFSGGLKEEKVFCPCHSQQTRNWRNLMNISIGAGECESKGRFETPNNFVDHLNSKKDCMFHQYLLQYLEELYSDWHLNHIKNRERKCEFRRLRERATEQLELEKNKAGDLQDRMEDLQRVNSDQAKRLEDHEKLLRTLGVDLTDPKRAMPQPSLDDDMLSEYKSAYADFWNRIHRRFNAHLGKSEERTIRVEHGFSLQDRFDKWSSSSAEDEFASVLSRDFKDKEGKDPHDDVRHLLSRWTIQYEVPSSLQGASKGLKKSVEAIDAGGPEAQFFAQCWKQLPGLVLHLPGTNTRVKLFEETQNGYPSYIPSTEARFKSMFEKKELSVAEQKVRLCYRAIGRLVVHCLSVGHAIPNEVLPKLLCNAVFRGCFPTSKDYLRLDLGNHLALFGVSDTTVDFLAEEAETVNDFCENVQRHFLSGRQWWIQSFGEGLYVTISREEKVPISSHFRFVPLEAVERMTQATHAFTADEVFAVLVPKYEGDDILQKSQEKLFTQALPALLKDWQNSDRTMLQRFLSFCTGQTYLPAGSFTITVEFEISTVEGNSTSDFRLPESHTCEKSLSFPLTAYNGNIETFRSKLTEAVNCGFEQFTMN